MIAVGDYLQQRRKAAGLTQKDVAEELGVVDRTISDWEAGRYPPSYDLLLRFIRLINGQVEEVVKLFFGDDDRADRRAEFEQLAASLSDRELDAAITAIRELRADPRRYDGLPASGVRQPKRIRRRRGSDQSSHE